MGASFLNTFTSGEISDDAWERNDIQPIAKGCREATNFVLRIAGPLGKRRGFWRLGAVADETKPARLIPFRRSVDDALMLEFGNASVRVWQADGSPLLDAGVQVTFASPYGWAQLAGLRYKQVADVIYFRHAAGLAPFALSRLSDTNWVFNAETFPNGPWLPENIDPTLTVTVTGTSVADATPGTGAGVIAVGEAITLTASQPLFAAGHVGAAFRLRQNNGAPGVKTWSTGFRPPVAGCFCASAGRVYNCTALGTGALTSGVDQAVTTPPVVTTGSQSDGGNTWAYLHDGAGIVEVTAFVSATQVTGVVRAAVPMLTGASTSCVSESAYSSYRGWPRMWPSVIEERLVNGATASNLDMLDLTETAGFSPTSETFTPGLGTGQVTDVDGIRRRVGEDGAQILWSQVAPFLLLGTASGEHIAAAGLFGEPVTPSTIAIRRLSGFGSADVAPVLMHKAVCFVTRGGEGLRKMQVDVQQNLETDDLSFLAEHIARLGFAQLAWIPYPDEVLWARLADGGLAAMTNHEEQQVRGWTRQRLPGDFIVEDIASLPGPGKFETLWMVVSRAKGGVTQRQLWMQSQPSDGLFMDGAELYQGAPATVIGGLAHYEGETVRALADGIQVDALVTGGAINLDPAAGRVLVGLGYKTRFESQTLDLQGLAAAIGLRQRITQLIVKLKTVVAKVSNGQGGISEEVSARTPQDVPGPIPRVIRKQVTVGGDSNRDPTIVIEEDTAYDHVIYSVRSNVAVGS